MFACIYVPDFYVQAALRKEANHLRSRPVAILAGPESLLKVFAVNQVAQHSGIATGMTQLQAETCPGIVLRKRLLSQEESAQAALLDCSSSFSPRIEDTLPGATTLDVSGTERLLGGVQEIGRKMAKAAKEHGLFVRVGMAHNPDTALHLARGFKGISVAPQGREAAILASLPTEILQPSVEMLEVLDRWGIRNLGALDALPSISLVERFGQKGLRLQRLARGEVRRELIPAEAPFRFEESLELEESVELLEPLGFILNRLLCQITARLVSRSLGTDHIHVALELEVHPDQQLGTEPRGAETRLYQREFKLPVPTQDPELLLKLLQLDLAAHSPDAPVKKVSIRAEPAKLRSTQVGLFMPLAPEAGKLEIAMARVRAVVGESDKKGRIRVGSPKVLDSNAPDHYDLSPFRPPGQKRLRESAKKGVSCLTSIPPSFTCKSSQPGRYTCDR